MKPKKKVRTQAQEDFWRWCNYHYDITRSKTADIFGIDLRTVHRYLSCTTEPHGGVVRLMEVFSRHPAVETEMIKRHGV